MGHLLVLCPSHRDHRELVRFAAGMRISFHDYASIALEQMVSPVDDVPPVGDPQAEIDGILARFKGEGVDGVVSTDDYPGSTLASIVASELGLPGTAPRQNLLCQHKFRSRMAQRAAVPEVVPQFALLGANGVAVSRYPCFIKPIKSFFSIGACKVESAERLHELRSRATLPEPFFAPFAALYERYAGEPFGDGRVLVEDLLEGRQVTVEGFAFDGRIEIVGVVDSVFFPGTLAFRRFDYPSRLPASIQERMCRAATEVMRAKGFTHGQFNIEFMYNPDRDAVHIIEINPRMASQFADLYEKVDGLNSYEVLIDLALGRAPRMRRREGRHGVAVSYVLRRFRDGTVRASPTEAHIAALHRRHPDARVEVLAPAGTRLSHEMQDGVSYRYGIVSIGARNWGHAEHIIAECVDALPFEIEKA